MSNIKIVVWAFILATAVTFFSMNPNIAYKSYNNKYSNEVKQIISMDYFKKQIKMIDNLPVN